MVNTDPPYGVSVEPRSNNAIAAGLSSFEGTKHHQSLDLSRHPERATPTDRKLRARDSPLANDFVSPEEFDRLLHLRFGNLARALAPGRSFYIWGGYSNPPNYLPVLAANGLFSSQAIVWNKLHPVFTRKDFMGCFELAFYGWRREGNFGMKQDGLGEAPPIASIIVTVEPPGPMPIERNAMSLFRCTTDFGGGSAEQMDREPAA
jgi:DNA modification methylase